MKASMRYLVPIKNEKQLQVIMQLWAHTILVGTYINYRGK